VLEREAPAQGAAELIATALAPLLWRFPWPKSMRWGAGSAFTWVRPLRRILCLLDGEVVPFALRQGEDDAHGLRAGNATEGHRFHAPGAFAVGSAIQWREKLRERRVIVDAAERRHLIETGLVQQAAARSLSVVKDEGLLDEVAGLVEWPVVHIGAIDPSFMDLPPEVMQVSMRVNQKYFTLRHADGLGAPHFAFVSNVGAVDGGDAVVAGNERVLRARFADARHFWDQDRRQTLESRVPALDNVTFHAKLGSQGDRVKRIAALARIIAPQLDANAAQAERAARLCKADLVSGMVGEFPELQGVMGYYYARHDREPLSVAEATRDHYAPRGPADSAPAAPVSIVVALADKLDQLAGFFAIGEIPTGSGDPYALRRAALGIIRIVRERDLRLGLDDVLQDAATPFSRVKPPIETAAEVFAFLVERLRVALREQGQRHDTLASVFAAGGEDDLNLLVRRADAVAGMLASPTGMNLLVGYRRAANILRIERQRDGRDHDGPVIDDRLVSPQEQALASALPVSRARIEAALRAESFDGAIEALAALREPIDAFFDRVTVNADDAALRDNRLNLLATIVRQMNAVADFSKIEG
jgi:glycyl-tRNA synthetase beta chain